MQKVEHKHANDDDTKLSRKRSELEALPSQMKSLRKTNHVFDHPNTRLK